jgi:putative tricarboxylic transport membrane protein
MSDETGSAASLRSGRVGGVVIVALSALYLLGAASIKYAFASDPIGPRGFPYGLGALLLALGVFYALKPGESEPWPDRRGKQFTIGFIFLCVATTLAMPIAGFITSMAVLCAGVAAMFGATPVRAVVSGAGHAVFWWLIFGPLLGGNLPKGPLGF